LLRGVSLKDSENLREVSYDKITDFTMKIKYSESDPSMPETHYDSHVHQTCEILVHISGDISFNVENNLYPVMPGNIIITRPYEYHHCIYRSDDTHKHFCIFLSAENNEFLYDICYNRKAGEKNLLILPREDSEKLIALCHEIVDMPKNQFSEYSRFFKLLQYLYKAEVPDTFQHTHKDVIMALTYINAHLSEKTTVGLIAKKVNVSINTLERHFHDMLHTTPTEYLRQKRLAKAAELLDGGYNVSETSGMCGFADTSAFISKFRQAFGVTPLQYKKKII